MVLEAKILRLGCQHDQVLVKALLCVADCQLLAVALPGGRGQEALSGLFYKGINLIHEGSALMTWAPPNDLTS